MLLTMAAVFMGTALTIRDLIGERPIFQREQAVGLSTKAYLLAKMAVFFVFAIIQSAIATTIMILGKGAPTQPALLLGNATLELFVATAATCVASAMLGLVLSSLARSNEQIMPLLVVSLMLQLVLSGGMVPVTDRIFLDQLSWVMPSRWGYAASASTVDLRTLVPGRCAPGQPLQTHGRHVAVRHGMLAALSIDLRRHRAVAHPAQALTSDASALPSRRSPCASAKAMACGRRRAHPPARRSPQRRVHGRAAQVGVVQPGAGGPRTGEVGAAQHGLAQVGLHQAGLPQPAAAQVDAPKVVAAEHREGEIHLVERHRPHPALHEHRAQHAALRKVLCHNNVRGRCSCGTPIRGAGTRPG